MVRVFAHGIPKCTFLSEKQFLIVFSLQETLSRSFTSPLLFSYEISLRISWVLSFQASLLHLSASFMKIVVQPDTYLPRGVFLIRQLGSTACPESRSAENACWAGGAHTKTPSRESGS